jgi:LacI family transcriptional regulator
MSSLLDRHLKVPKYLQLAETLRCQITNGILQPGDQLPSFVQMRSEFGATQNTVEKVFSLLEQDGLIIREPSRGTFVAPPKARIRTGVIGYIGSTFDKSQMFSYFADIANGVQSEAERMGKRLLLLGDKLTWNENDLDKVDGVLLCDAEGVEHTLQRLQAELPCVAMLVAAPNVSSVIADDAGGAKNAVRHLLELGHRRIACLMSSGYFLLDLRVQGYQEALKEYGVELDSAWVKRPHLSATPSDYVAWGRNQVEAWLKDGWAETGCTALFAQNDLAAIGAIQALQNAQIRVPEEVSVVGFDGTSLCEYVAPQLSSVGLPLYEMGARAVRLLCEQIEKPSNKVENIVLPTCFQTRESSATCQVNLQAH